MRWTSCDPLFSLLKRKADDSGAAGEREGAKAQMHE